MSRSHDVRRVAVAVAVLLAVVALDALLSVLGHRGATTPGVMSDTLGPDPGEAVVDYRSRAAASLDSGPASPRWALVTFDRATGVTEAASATAGLPRVSRVYGQVPRRGVAMPVEWHDVPEPAAGREGGPASDRAAVLRDGLSRAAATARAAAPPGRSESLATLTGDRLAAGEPGVVALLVRGDLAGLRGVAARPGVRAVEAAPDGAVVGRFAVRPLLPQQLVAADPLADDAPVPAG